MNKLEKIINKAEECLDYDNKDKLDKFIFKYGKWFILLSPLIFFNSLLFENVHKFHIAIPIIFSITYLFCLFFCFIDIYRYFKKK